MAIFGNGKGEVGVDLAKERPMGTTSPYLSPPPIAGSEVQRGICPGVGSALKEDAQCRDELTDGDGPVSTKGNRSTKVIVLVPDQANANHWEITVIDSASEAERLLERWLEHGTDQDGIRVFTGAEIGMRVTYKPVVTLASNHTDKTGTDDAAEPQSGALVCVPQDAHPDLRAASIPAPDGIETPVRFSSLFRPVGDPPAFSRADHLEELVKELTPA